MSEAQSTPAEQEAVNPRALIKLRFVKRVPPFNPGEEGGVLVKRAHHLVEQGAAVYADANDAPNPVRSALGVLAEKKAAYNKAKGEYEEAHTAVTAAKEEMARREGKEAPEKADLKLPEDPSATQGDSRPPRDGAPEGPDENPDENPDKPPADAPKADAGTAPEGEDKPPADAPPADAPKADAKGGKGGKGGGKK